MDTLRIVLFVMYVQAYLCIKLSRVFEYILAAVLKLPDSWLSIIPTFTKLVDSNGNPIKIINAISENAHITNKLKIFLMFYYELANEESMHTDNGFSFDKLQQLISCSMLYCSYIVMHPSEEPNVLIDKLKYFYITSIVKDNKKHIIKTANCTSNEVPFGHIVF
jgi:hypothetical protein